MSTANGSAGFLRSRAFAFVLVIRIVAVLGGGFGALKLWHHLHAAHGQPGQGLSIPTQSSAEHDPVPSPTPAASPASPGGPPFVTSVSVNGRYFVDQYGAPILVRGDSPWSMFTDLTPAGVETYLANRASYGFNAIIVSLIGATANGASADDGATVDGILPFVGGDVLTWNDAYWDRVHSDIQLAADKGITVFLYPIDGWTIGHAFVPKSIDQCETYGQMVADRFADLQNIVWLTGGDYFPVTNEPAEGSDVDHCFDAMLRGIRHTGNTAPFSIQLGYQKSVSTDNPYWARRVDWNFVYSYYPTYRAVLDAYDRSPVVPTLFGEGNYDEGDQNGHPDTPPTTDETLRRQVLWALTSGSAGDFYGSFDWAFYDGWQSRLDASSVQQVARLRALFASLHWWDLVPDESGALVSAGRGDEVSGDAPLDVLQNDYATVSCSRDGSLAVVYVPTVRTITLNLDRLDPSVAATWIDPASGAAHPAEVATSMRPPGMNSEGDGDWLLILSTAGLIG